MILLISDISEAGSMSPLSMALFLSLADPLGLPRLAFSGTAVEEGNRAEGVEISFCVFSSSDTSGVESDSLLTLLMFAVTN